MMYLTPISSIFQYFDDYGSVLSGGKIYIYESGTNNQAMTFTDSTGNAPNSNPIILRSNGRLGNVQIWQEGGITLKIVIKDSNGIQVGPVFDEVSGINDPAASLSSLKSPAAGFGVDMVANAIKSCDSGTALRTYPSPVLAVGQTFVVFLEGMASSGDNLGGAFRWSGTSTSADDNLNVIKPDSSGDMGRYHRIVQP